MDTAFRTEGLVEKALAHVASIHPSVTQVVYDDDLHWCYSDSEAVPVIFGGTENISLLEDAADEAYDRGLQNVAIQLSASHSSTVESPEELDGGMGIEQCTHCMADLEASQIGLCDDCQPQGKTDHS